MRISDWSSDVCSSDLISAAIAERLLLSALRTTGVNNQPSTATAKPISARAKRNILSSANAALAAGKAMRAWAYALTKKSLTENLIDPLSFTRCRSSDRKKQKTEHQSLRSIAYAVYHVTNQI